MSGHSHAKTIAHAKGIADAKKGAIFSKFGRLITIAAKEGGDPAVNSKLKMIIEQAKSFNMPKENIERATKKGVGSLPGEKLEEFSLEGFGPGGIAIIIEGITDNKNRTIGEIRSVLSKHRGKLAGEGAVKWMFEKRGDITISSEGKNKEELELLAIDSGADDVRRQDGFLDIYTNPDTLEKVKNSLEEKHLKIEQASLGWLAKEDIVVSEKDNEFAQKLFEELNENDAVQDIYSNLVSGE